MPYISRNRREQAYSHPLNAGELNYALTRKILQYLKGKEGYRTFNEVIGVLECVKQELYRRKVAPYEDYKIEQNGDVY